ncbi:tRNA (adenosine(37)-N6)-dimethylallyltransferase MiaA [Adlercreutzia sp. ZJ154]|uniref:tRNA (adenosine(37)-N6)-dimethylallyltransferase MiaA n=1 Tax=Adlercreutzia sp. ZJ154 TaxID=2709790 RepID=UPI0013EDCA68|nr:tRNA (adenosine(37)-N6)-dimethylallyltransferase MiaA [Adlercreutzia sp. ZJ154]
MESLLDKVICIVGPTATGKSDLAQNIALELDGEIISADSMQVYKGMDIGTGKIPIDQRRVMHHGLDLVYPNEPYSAALFQEYARRTFKEVRSRKHASILAGGTGFYVRAAIDNYDFPKGEQVDNPIRKELVEYLDKNGTDALWNRLKSVDPKSAECIHKNNSKRVMRALELYADGKSYANQLEKLSKIEQLVPALMIGLSVSPDTLAKRIDTRVDKMRELGLEQEVERLLEEGFEEWITAPQAIGYKEIVSAKRGECTIDDAFQSIKQATRRYAKRQRTWFRKDRRIVWIDAETGNMTHMLEQVLQVIENPTNK